MPTCIREGRLRIVIYSDDHPRPHVHVLGEGETKVALLGIDGEPEIIRIVGCDFRESRRALRIVRENAAYLLEQWNKIHG